ncbi:MAG: hypothetical protein J0M18_13580 [Ignavibacteria bacterium]|nr:hypothetical protein [Ignavibacteria bacterium]
MSEFNFKKIIYSFAGILVFLNLIFMSSCNVLGPDEYSTDILITDETGRVIGGDFSDWCSNGISNEDNRISLITGNLLTVNIDSLKISKDSNRVSVSWITATEENCRKFNLERLRIGYSTWDTVKKTNCIGGIGMIGRYKLIDTLQLSGKYKYRIRQIDSNLTSTIYSINDTVSYGIIGVNPISSTPNSYSFGAAYPNPAVGKKTTLNFQIPQNIFVRVYLDNDENIVNSNLNAGSYQVEIDGATYGFSNEVRRVYIEAGNFKCYGDIQFR